MKVLLLFTVVALTYAKQPCVAPFEFQTRERIILLTPQSKTECIQVVVDSEVYYDYRHQKLRSDGTATINGVSTDTTYFAFYNDGVNYVVDNKQGTCTKGQLSGKLDKPEIPPNSMYDGNVYIGEQSLDVWRETNKTTALTTIYVVTPVNCVPVSVTVLNSTGTVLQTISFLDFVPGIPPHVWDLPASCKKAHLHNRSLSDLAPKWRFF